MKLPEVMHLERNCRSKVLTNFVHAPTQQHPVCCSIQSILIAPEH